MANSKVDLSTIKARGERQSAARGQPLTLSTTVATPELPERASVLPERLRELARWYLNARQKTGESLLEMGRWLSEARQEAVHGQWKIFLEATGTSEDQAESFIGVHKQALRDLRFADAVRRNFLSISAAYELISAPADVQDRVLESEQPTTRKQIREEKRAANSAPARSFEQPMLPDMPAPAQVADLPAEYAIIQRRFLAHGITLLSNMQGQHRAFVTRKEGMTGVVTFDWADVLSKLERLEERAAALGPAATYEAAETAAPAHWVEPTCGKFVANGKLAVWAGEHRERLSAKERAMLVTEARALIGSLAKMIEALT